MRDPATRINYAADRSNAGAHMISGTFTIAGQAIRIIGQQAATSSLDVDAVRTVTRAGGGNRTRTAYDVTDPVAPVVFQTDWTGGSFRVDEMVYSPMAKALAAKHTNPVAFGPVVRGGADPGTITHIDGRERPVRNPDTGIALICVPMPGGGTDLGGVVEIKRDLTAARLFAALAAPPGNIAAAGANTVCPLDCVAALRHQARGQSSSVVLR